MALDFPAAPAVNDTFSLSGKTWKWDGEKWLMVQVGPKFTTSDSAPANPAAGDVWIDSTDGSQFIYMDSFWVEFGSDMGPTGADSLSPVGIVNPYAGSTAPTNWMLCYGQAISRTSYAGLYAVVGTTYGVGDGSTTFNLPDLRGRTVAALDNMGGSDAARLNWANTLGTAGGAQTHTLTGAESGTSAHSHSINHDHGSTNATSGTESANHSHSNPAMNYSTFYRTPDHGIGTVDYLIPSWAGGLAFWAANGLKSADHTHTTAVDLPNFTGTSGNSSAADASSAHNNMQPTLLLNYIIKVM